MKTVIIDLEATCCNQGTFPRNEMEIIEIGAVLVEGPNQDVTGEFQTFIKPVRHPLLTEFCISLSTIQQRDVDSAPEFKAAFPSFLQWLRESGDPILASWGAYDLKQIYQDCDFHHFPRPPFQSHRNLKAEFSESIKSKKRLGMSSALKKLGIPLEGTHHRGIDDARNIARIFQCLERGPKA